MHQPQVKDLPIKDSGKREEFTTGCVRDTEEGKLQWSLLPPCVWQATIGEAVSSTPLVWVNKWYKGEMSARALLSHLIDAWGLERLEAHLVKGAEKYSKFNWVKGMEVSRCVNSAGRHAYSVAMGEEDEDHKAALMANIAFIAHYEKHLPHLNDMLDEDGQWVYGLREVAHLQVSNNGDESNCAFQPIE